MVFSGTSDGVGALTFVIVDDVGVGGDQRGGEAGLGDGVHEFLLFCCRGWFVLT